MNWKSKFAYGFLLVLALTVREVTSQVADPCLSVPDTDLKKVLLTSGLTYPMEMAISPDKRVFMVERLSGKIRIFDLSTAKLSDAGQVAVFTATHEGLLGITLDPGFAVNHFVYIYYSHASIAKHILARYTESAGKLDDATMKVILEVPGIRWTDEHHSAGSLAFGPDGNLYLSTGENVDPNVSNGYASVNEALRKEDTQATAANTNDLNGKILRIHPEPDGSYTLPTGNLFTTTAKTRGEIYAMGMRNPIRIAVDSKTGWLYWGEPGPDATFASTTRGPLGQDEINRAKAPGFFGWPYFIADNQPYIQNGTKQVAASPVNNSPNNTGEVNLPPAQPALLSYSDDGNPKYPSFGVANPRAAMVGAIYNFNANQSSSKRLPRRFDGSLFIMDWARHWINEVTFLPTGEVAGVSPFFKEETPNGPIDMAFGPEGDMYLLEYDSHALYQIQYTGSCQMTPTTGISGQEKRLYATPDHRPYLSFFHPGVQVPAGTHSVTVFDGSGKQLWQVELGNSTHSRWVEFPQTLANLRLWLQLK